MQNQGKKLNQTFIPKTMLRKTQLKNTNPLIQKNSFEKTHGNNYVQLDPPEIKFNGYQINKINTLNFKIINKAPIPQRFNILPPTESHFSIKVNKKGNIPSGMYQTVQVSFKATDYKYLYDVVKVNTQTQNFVLPLYAYPTIPNINTLFPKLIDFGNIQINKTQSFLYPIKNPTPIDYKFDFLYKKQCAQIMINPLTGIIPGNGQFIVQMAFIPNKKMTYSAEVYFKMQQFDFQPIYIQIMGSGKQKQLGKTFKRLKSSKLVPLKQKEEIDNQQKEKMNQTDTFLNQKIKDAKKSFQTSVRKINSKITYPKLLNTTMKQKNSQSIQRIIPQLKEKSLQRSHSQKNTQQRRYMSRYTKIQQLDKQKDIKFQSYLGDSALTQQQIQFERNIIQQMDNFRKNLLRNQCQTRYNPQKNDGTWFELQKVKSQKCQWDENKNDFIYERKNILNKFVIAASKIIQKGRILKRFQKVKDFLSDCETKEQVTKKVEQSYQKSLDMHSQNPFKNQINLNFNKLSLSPTFIQIQFSEGKQKLNDRFFKTQGKTQFDDLTNLELIEPYQNEKMSYVTFPFPPDYVDLSKKIPSQRISGQQQFSVKSSSLPNIQPIQSFATLSKQFLIPNHYFIHQSENVALFKQYNSVDEKSSIFLFSNNQKIEDQFEGWSKGEMEVLKAKLLKNSGVEYVSQSLYNFSSLRNDIGFEENWTKNLPEFIDKPYIEDIIQDDDSDDQKYEEGKIQTVQEFLDKIQVNPQIKARRQKNIVFNEEKKNKARIETNLQKDKLKRLTKFVEKVKNLNKVVEISQNQLIL